MKNNQLFFISFVYSGFIHIFATSFSGNDTYKSLKFFVIRITLKRLSEPEKPIVFFVLCLKDDLK